MALPRGLILRVGRAEYITLVDLRRGYRQVPLARESGSHGLCDSRWPVCLARHAIQAEKCRSNVSAHNECAPSEPSRLCLRISRRHRDIFGVVGWAPATHVAGQRWPNRKNRQLPNRPTVDRVPGHVIGSGRHAPDPTKIEAIRGLQRQVTKKEVRSVLGLCSYYRVRSWLRRACPTFDRADSKVGAKHGPVGRPCQARL